MELQEGQIQWRRRVFASTWLAYFGFYFCRKPFFLLKKELEEERVPAITMGLLRRVQSVLEQGSTGVLPSEESVKELINILEAEERKVAQVS